MDTSIPIGRDAVERKIKLIKKFVNRLGVAGLTESHKKELGEAAGRFEAALLTASRDLSLKPVDSITSNCSDIGAVDNWDDLCQNVLCDLNLSGAVNSVADALVKSKSYLDWVDSRGSLRHSRHFFRGEHKMGRPLVSRRGREFRNLNLNVTEARKVTEREVDDIKKFQKLWKERDIEAHEDDLSRFHDLDPMDSTWWSLMQHYDQNNGTRLLDVTSSLLSGLYFACVSKDGKIDRTEDGILYLFHERGMNARLMYKGARNDFEDDVPDTWDKMFDYEHEGTPRLYIPYQLSESVKSQGGAFLWWPKFDAPYPNPLFCLRISGHSKERIVRELLAYGVNPKFIMSYPRGADAQEALFKDLGLEPRPYEEIPDA